MQIVFLAYSNSSHEPLQTLLEEDQKVYSILSRRAGLLHFSVHRDSYADPDSIIEFLELYRQEIILFSFSGHAGRDHLVLRDVEVASQGIVGLLSNCPKLRLILLNGCSTGDQVKRLIALPNRPVVIATKAPVGDFSAAKFGISFFRELGERYGSIEDAFRAGLNAANTIQEHPIHGQRGLSLSTDVELKTDSWGIYTMDPKALHWKLPVATDAQQQRTQTLTWIRWWMLYQLAGLILSIATVLFQVSASSFILAIIPLFFFFAPFPSTLRTKLNKKRLYTLISFHALIYFSLLFVWMGNDLYSFFVFLIAGLVIYFIILPLINGRYIP